MLLTLVIPACCAGITACGQAARPAAAPRVRLELRAPADGTRVPESAITVSGTVSPARSEVLVLGRPATVTPEGAFSARVRLNDGVNLIDVLASLPHASDAMSAVRVDRYELVAVPPLLGLSPGAAEAAIRSAGLVPKDQSSDGTFSFLLPLPEQVCSASPGPGAEVSPGSTVTLDTSKLCGGGSSAAAAQTPPPPAKHDNGRGNGGIPGQGGDQGNQGNGGD